MADGPTDTIKDTVSDVADAALGVAGAVVGVVIASKGVDMIVGDSGSSDEDVEGETE